jgi:hypothetical protein
MYSIALVKLKDTKVVYRVAINGIHNNFFKVIELVVAPKGARADDVTISQNLAPLGIDYKALRLAYNSQLGLAQTATITRNEQNTTDE